MPQFLSDQILTDHICPSIGNTPASPQRPARTLLPAVHTSLIVTIITPLDTTDACAIQRLRETSLALSRMTFTRWEWLIVYLPSLTAEGHALVASLASDDSRIRVLPTEAASLAEACNAGVQAGVGTFLMQLACGDLLEPTFIEKALWVLESQEHFAACDAYVVEFGASQVFHDTSVQKLGWSILDHRLPFAALLRRAAWDTVGGYQSSGTLAQAQLAFWGVFASAGLAAYTIEEYLSWRRTPAIGYDISADTATMREGQSSIAAPIAEPCSPTPTVSANHESVHRDALAWRSASPIDLHFDRPALTNTLTKPHGIQRVLMLTAHLVMGGAARVGLDLVTMVPRESFEFTVVTTLPARDEWMEQFTNQTPDVFRLPQFLDVADYPRFIDYLIESRGIDTILVNNSEIGYTLAPYLQARHPQVAILDFCHAEEEWRDGGYPALSLAAGSAIDYHITCTEHLRAWMCARGADPERIEVVYSGVDTSVWRRNRYDSRAIRARWNLPPDLPVLLSVGRISTEKRPQVLVDILRRLVAQGCAFVALIAGEGPEEAALRQAISASGIEEQVRMLGALPAEAVRELMAIGDTLVLPSAREGLALVLYECMAMSVPPVAADVGGQAELVTQDCGYVIAPGPDEIDRYVAACADLLLRPQHREELAVNARRRVEEHFDLSLMATKMVAAFQSAQLRAAARPDAPVDPTTASARVANAYAHARANELFLAMQTAQSQLAVQQSMIAELRRWGADQEQLLAVQESTIAELRQRGEDQEQLIVSLQLALAEPIRLLARMRPALVLQQIAVQSLRTPKRGWRRLRALLARKHRGIS